MATVGVRSPAIKPDGVPARTGPKLSIVDDEGHAFVFPFAPIETPVTGLAPVWTEVDRTGNRPALLVYSGPGSKGVTLEAFVTDTRRPTDSRELDAYALTAIVKHGRRLFLRNFGTLSTGPWRCIDLTITPSRRQPGTNAVAAFTASLTLQSASEAVTSVGTITGGAKTTRVIGATTVRVKPGETLAQVAYRALGSTAEVNALAWFNNIKDHRKIKAGQVLALPPQYA